MADTPKTDKAQSPPKGGAKGKRWYFDAAAVERWREAALAVSS